MASSPDDPRVRAFDSLAVFVLAWLWLSLRGEPPLNPDSSRDLAFARDLVDGVELHLHGAWASFAALQQGTAWIDLLALCRRLGLGVVGIQRVITTLLAIAVAATHHGVAQQVSAAGPIVGSRLIARAGPIVGAMALLASLPATCEMPLWWQPLLLPVPVVFAHLALWRLLDRGELIDAVALAILCGLAFDVHVVAIVLLAVLAFAVPLAARRPGVATPAAAAAALGVLLLSSSSALSGNFGRARELGWLVPGAALVVALVVAGLLLRSRLARLSLRRRLELAVAIEALLVAAVVLAARHPSTPELAGRYLLPFGPGLVLAVALVISHGGGTRNRALIVGGLAAVLLATSTSSLRAIQQRSFPRVPAYSQRELETIAEALGDHTWAELVVRLQGPAHDVVLGGLSAWVDPGEPPEQVDAGLLLVAFTPSVVDELRRELPESTRVVALADADALLIETPARLDRATVSVCSEDQTCEPVLLAVDRRVHQAHPKAWIAGRSASEWLRERSDGPVRWVSWRFAVRPGPAAVLALPPYHAPHCAWQVIASEGFELSGLPATSIELPAEAEGSLTIARDLHEDDPDCAGERLEFPPAPIELEPSWTRLRAALLGP